jgi:hypothetical protein
MACLGAILGTQAWETPQVSSSRGPDCIALYVQYDLVRASGMCNISGLQLKMGWRADDDPPRAKTCNQCWLSR